MIAAPLVLDRPAEETDDSAKRRQIIEGARIVFRVLGFDAASMGEIAKAAGVSKGTLYVYFKDKDELFQAIVEKECVFQAEGVFDLDASDPDVAGTLTHMGIAFVKALCVPERLSTFRTVCAMADRKPNAGGTFYETGPAVGRAKVRAYFEAQVAAIAKTVRNVDRRSGTHNAFTKAMPMWVRVPATSGSLASKSKTPSAWSTHSFSTIDWNSSSLSLK